ncbi:MAG TPA: hypothetical protein VD994_18375 [Prosthecobacter sp.]|nr:hypothetical protein [Prosthecobacter sp.]
MSPLAIAFFIALGVALVGFAIAYARRKTTLRGYEEITKDVQALREALKAEMFRDGEDLVLSGDLGRFPTQVRFSYSQNTPGLNIRVQAPATFSLAAVSKSLETGAEGRVVLRTGDDIFDSKFTIRTDQPNNAKIFLGSRAALGQMQKLCCSMNTSVALQTGLIEHNELTIPTPFTARHVQDHLNSIQALATMLERMPGSELPVARRFRERTSWRTRAAVAVGVIAAAIVVYTAVQPNQPTQASEPDPAITAGVKPADGTAIPALRRYRVAPTDAFDLVVANWASSNGVNVTSTIEGRFLNAASETPDTAYYLRGEQGQKRVVIVSGGQNKYDSEFVELAGIVRVPQSAIQNIEWSSVAPEAPDGDGLLIVRSGADTTSGVVIFFHQGRLTSGVPANYQFISLQ